MKPITWSFGMQSRAGSRIGEKPDFDGCAKMCEDADMTEAIVFGKDHTGFCFYPTEIGTPHPKLKCNLTRGLTDALHRRGMKSYAYFNLGMDGEMGRRHHEWLQSGPPGEWVLTKDHYASLCLYGPAFDEYVMPLIEEMFLLNDIDGIFFDPVFCFEYCGCAGCGEKFREKFGVPMPKPDDPANPAWKLHGSWHYERVSKLMDTIRQRIFKIRPRALVIFNHLGGPAYPFPFPGVMDAPVSCDPVAATRDLSRFSNYASTFAITGDVFPDRFVRGWGDRSDLDDATLEHKCATVFMYGQRLCVGDRMHPDCSLAPGARHAAGVIGRVWKQMNRLIPADARLNPDILCLYSHTLLFGRNYEHFGRPDYKNHRKIYGTQRLLTDCGRSFMLAPEMNFGRHLNPERLLILPSVKILEPETEKQIRAFLRNGGTLLVLETLPRLNSGAIPDWTGIRAVNPEVYQPCIYLPDWNTKKIDRERVLVRGDIHEITTGTAETLLYGFPQYDLSRMGAGFNSSADTPSHVPLLTRNRYGKGTVYFLNAPLFSDYISGCPGQKQWAETLLRKIRKSPVSELDSPSGNVEMTSWRHSGGSLHILVNHGGLEHELFADTSAEILRLPQPVYPVTLKVRAGKVSSVTVNGKKTTFSVNGNFIRIPLKMDSIWKIVNVKDSEYGQ